MACKAFDPDLPHGTDEEKQVWLSRWTSNLVNTTCMQDMCANMCLPGFSPASPGCLTCLKNQQCDGTYSCVKCVGSPERIKSFDAVYDCTVSTLEPSTTVGIIIGILFGIMILVFVIGVVLVRTRRMPYYWKIHNDVI